jgi:O-antigen ligase
MGFLMVNALFFMWRFNMKTLGLALLALLVCSLFLPGAIYERVTMGFASGDANTVSAGRINEIWLPLLPEVLRAPPWGNGLGSTMWSDAMNTGTMLVVGHPHSAYLEAVLDLGIIGALLLCAYYVHVWRGFRSLGSNPYLTPAMRGFFQGGAAGLISFAVSGWVGSSLTPRPEYCFLWFAIGMMYGQLARKPAS